MKKINTLPSIKIVTNLLVVIAFALFSKEAVAQHGQFMLDHTSNVSQYLTADRSDDNGLTPFVLERKGARSRYLYLASELYIEGADVAAREITSLAFDVTKLGSNVALTDYYITLAPTDDLSLGNNMNALAGATVVKYIASLKINATGWYEIEFDTPFLWNGTSNLVIEICKTNSSVINLAKNVEVATTKHSSGSYYRSWALVNASNNSSSPDGCDMLASNNPYNVSGFYNSLLRRARPNIRFTFKCDGNTTAGKASMKTISNYCLGENVELTVIDGEQSSGLDYQWLYSNNNIDFFDIPGETNAKLHVERNEIDFYYLRATGCSVDSPDNGKIFSQAVKVKGINTWNGTSWSKGHSPAMSEPVRISGDFDTANHGGILEACSIEILSGNIIIRSEHSVKIKDKLKIAETANVIFETNASLVQENETAINEGKIKYRRDSQSVRLLDYTYWSSPVSGQTPNAFSVGTPNSKIYFWNHLAGVQNWNGGVHNLPMVAGRGYIIRAPNGYPASGVGQVFHGEFNGVPNNGEILVETQGKNPDPMGNIYWNLIGNPYPSAVDADLFLLANSDKIDGTLKYWTHNSTPSGHYPGNQGLNYTSNDYASYNFTGSVGYSAGTVLDPNDPAYIANTTEPGSFIAAGQSFMVSGGPTSGLGTVKFKNDMRVIGDNSTFFRTANTNTIATLEKNRIWLEMKHQEGAFKQTLVGYIEGATDGVDWGFDGKMLETSPVLIYTKAEEQNLIIQGKALPFVDTDQIPLGFSTTLAGTFDLNLYRFDGLFDNQVVYVEDTYTNTIHNLKDGIYTFNAVPGVFDDRFIIRFTNETLSLTNPTVSLSDVICFSKNQVINLHSFTHSLTNVIVFDASGRMLYQNSSINASELKIDSIMQQNQLLLVKVTTEEGIQSTYKLIY